MNKINLEGRYRVLRGGCWFNYELTCELGTCDVNDARHRGNSSGFRVARTILNKNKEV